MYACMLYEHALRMFQAGDSQHKKSCCNHQLANNCIHIDSQALANVPRLSSSIIWSIPDQVCSTSAHDVISCTYGK